MTQLLISVTSVEEAQLALDNGADIIDLKDPHSGALGALPILHIKSIVNHLHTSRNPPLVSATIGDLPMQADLILEQVKLLASAKVDFVKIGFFEASDYHLCLKALETVTKSTNLIAVLFAEYIYPTTIVEDIRYAGFKGLMLDTVHKNGQTILYYHTRQYCENLAKKVRHSGMTFGLAGSLRLQDVEELGKVNPTYIGFRSGVCVQCSRKAALDPQKIIAISNALSFCCKNATNSW
ncbi:MAG: (5-formylfuran-3-yl)methyl phosphate synthase [Methylotenera sp.]|nr:(5-formylfuran-3-yl)methyl phosphate synthase [Methylotenera sp.]